MKLLILGATGPTGRHLVSQALEAGHDVAALVRGDNAPAGVEILRGDARDSATIAAAVRGRDAVLSALGVGKSFKAIGIMTRAAENLVAARVNRLLLVSAFGVGESYADARLLQKIFFKTVLRGIYADKKAADEIIRNSGGEWTIVLPTGLTNGPRTGKYRVGEHIEVPMIATISRADVADFMIGELVERKWIRKTVEISS